MGMEYEIELVDPKHVRSPPYQCAPPKLKVLREFVEDLIKKGVVRPSKSPYASPTFLLSRAEGGYRMVVDYRKVNKKIGFDSYPLSSLDQVFQCFSGATIFSVLDLNSAYFQIPLTERSINITAFCTPFGLYEFAKLPMGISVVCQGLSKVIDQLFADLKSNFVFNYLNDLVTYSLTVAKHEQHLKEVLDRLQKPGFTLNREKVVLGAKEIKYLGHCVSRHGVRVITDRVDSIKHFPSPKNLRSLRRLVGMVGFYARFIPEFSAIATPLHKLKGKAVKFNWGDEEQIVLIGPRKH
jgi:hypothetical protein